MWRYPFGKDHCTKCKNSCSSSNYSRVIKTRPEWDILPYTEVLQSTDAYKKSITNARQQSGSIIGFLMITACPGWWSIQKSITLSWPPWLVYASIWMPSINRCSLTPDPRLYFHNINAFKKCPFEGLKTMPVLADDPSVYLPFAFTSLLISPSFYYIPDSFKYLLSFRDCSHFHFLILTNKISLLQNCKFVQIKPIFQTCTLTFV